MSRKGVIFTFTGPSGTGKNTVMNALMKADSQIQYFVTATTREPRGYEKDGVDYHFLSKEEFHKKLDDGEFLEWSEHYGNFYGTLRKVLKDMVEEGVDPFGDITWTGAAIFKRKMPEDTVNILLMPPSLEALDERFEQRKKVSAETDEGTKLRLENIRMDIKHMHSDGYIFTNDDMKGSHLADYDYVVTNDCLDRTVQELEEIIQKERQKRSS